MIREELFIMSEEIKNEALTSEETSEVSKSKAKREARVAEVKAEKTKKSFDKVLSVVVGIIIAAIVIGAIGMGIYTSTTSTETVVDSDFSAGLTAEGFIEGANLSKVADLNLQNLVISFADVEYTDENVENDMASIASNLAYYDDNSELTVKDGDTINLDYVGSIDGVPFDGGNTNGNGASLTIGSHSYIDTFEDQLVGSHPGDAVTVEVTFPDPYDNNPDLAGKPAVFECTVNSIYVVPALTDELVKENYGDVASTVEELRAYAKEQGYKTNVMTYISNYVSENAKASSMPSSYVKHLRGLIKYNDVQTYNYYNQYYSYMLGYTLYDSFSAFTGKSDEEYEKDLKVQAKNQAANDMTYEALYKNLGLSVSEDTYNEVLAMYGNPETYGEGYLNQVAIKYTVLDYLVENANVQ